MINTYDTLEALHAFNLIKIAGVDMYCGHECGSQIVNGKFVNGGATNTTRDTCPNNDGNRHNMHTWELGSYMELQNNDVSKELKF